MTFMRGKGICALALALLTSGTLLCATVDASDGSSMRAAHLEASPFHGGGYGGYGGQGGNPNGGNGCLLYTSPSPRDS